LQTAHVSDNTSFRTVCFRSECVFFFAALLLLFPILVRTCLIVTVGSPLSYERQGECAAAIVPDSAADAGSFLF
jgi:hypothetical protein